MATSSVNNPPIPQHHNFGIPDPKINWTKTLPEIYSQSIKASQDSGNVPVHYLPYEWSPQAKVAAEKTGDALFWHEPLADVHSQVDSAMQRLKPLFNERVPTGPDDAPNMTLKQGLRETRTKLDTYMNHDPSAPDFEKNEVPRWQPDGTMHPDDAKFITADGAQALDKAGNPIESRLVGKMPAQAHLETILYRIPATHVSKQHWAGFDDAATNITRATEWLTTHNDKGRPDVEEAFKQLRQVKRDLESTLKEAGAPSTDASVANRLLNRWHDLTPGEQAKYRWIGIGALAAVAGVTAGAIVFDGGE